MKEEIKKPHFLSATITSISGITGFILTVLPFLVSSDEISRTVKIISVFAMWLLIIIINLIVYSIHSKKYCNAIERQYIEVTQKHIALSKEFDKKKVQICELEKIINAEDFLLNNLIKNMEASIINLSENEIEYLKKILSITYSNIEHINNLKGDNNGI